MFGCWSCSHGSLLTAPTAPLQAVFVYWITSNCFSLSQALLLKVPAVKGALKLPTVQAAPQALPQTATGVNGVDAAAWGSTPAAAGVSSRPVELVTTAKDQPLPSLNQPSSGPAKRHLMPRRPVGPATIGRPAERADAVCRTFSVCRTYMRAWYPSEEPGRTPPDGRPARPRWANKAGEAA